MRGKSPAPQTSAKMKTTSTSSPRLTANILVTLSWPRPPLASSRGHWLGAAGTRPLLLSPSFLSSWPWKKWLRRFAAAVGLVVVLGGIALWAAVRHYEAGLPGVAD